jgi:hypothetical protein
MSDIGLSGICKEHQIRVSLKGENALEILSQSEIDELISSLMGNEDNYSCSYAEEILKEKLLVLEEKRQELLSDIENSLNPKIENLKKAISVLSKGADSGNNNVS